MTEQISDNVGSENTKAEDLLRSKSVYARSVRASFATSVVLGLGGLGGIGYYVFMDGKIKERILEPERPAIVQNISRAENYLEGVSNKIMSLRSGEDLPYESSTMKKLYAKELANKEQEASGLEKTMELVRGDIQEMKNTFESRQYQSEVLSHQARLEQETYPYEQLGLFSFNCLLTSLFSLGGLVLTMLFQDLVYVPLRNKRKKKVEGGTR